MPLARISLAPPWAYLLIVALIASTVWILRPFLGAIIWAAMIVVATWPMMRRLQAWLWGSRKLAVAAMTAVWLLVLVLPLSLATGTIVSNAGEIVEWAASGAVVHHAATARVAGHAARRRDAGRGGCGRRSRPVPWATSRRRRRHTPPRRSPWMAGTLRSLGGLLVQFLLTLAIAAVMYAKGESAADGLLRFGRHLAGEPGDRVVRLAAQAIRGVALGVVVTAMVQAALASVGLAIAGVPFAALLAVVTFVFCIAQLGPALVLFPSVAWLYWQGATGTATALLLWTLVVVALDNVLRPILMTRGREPAAAADVRRRHRRPARVWSDRDLRRVPSCLP